MKGLIVLLTVSIMVPLFAAAGQFKLVEVGDRKQYGPFELRNGERIRIGDRQFILYMSRPTDGDTPREEGHVPRDRGDRHAEEGRGNPDGDREGERGDRRDREGDREHRDGRDGDREGEREHREREIGRAHV